MDPKAPRKRGSLITYHSSLITLFPQPGGSSFTGSTGLP